MHFALASLETKVDEDAVRVETWVTPNLLRESTRAGSGIGGSSVLRKTEAMKLTFN